MSSLAHLPVEILQHITSLLTGQDIAVRLRNCGNSILWSKLQQGGVDKLTIGDDIRIASQLSILLALPLFQGLTSLSIDIEIPTEASMVIPLLCPRLRKLELLSQESIEFLLRKMSPQEIGENFDPTDVHIRMGSYTPLLLSEYFPQLEELNIEADVSLPLQWPQSLRIRFLLGLPLSLTKLSFASFPFFQNIDIFRFLPPHLQDFSFEAIGDSFAAITMPPRQSLKDSLYSISFSSNDKYQYHFDPNDSPVLIPKLSSWFQLTQFGHLGVFPETMQTLPFSTLEKLRLDRSIQGTHLGDTFFESLPPTLKHVEIRSCSITQLVKWQFRPITITITTSAVWTSSETIPDSVTHLNWKCPNAIPMSFFDKIPASNLLTLEVSTAVITSAVNLSYLKRVQYLKIGGFNDVLNPNSRYPPNLTYLRLFGLLGSPASNEWINALPKGLKVLYAATAFITILESQIPLLPPSLETFNPSHLEVEDGQNVELMRHSENPDRAIITETAEFRDGKFRMLRKSGTRLIFTEKSQLKIPNDVKKLDMYQFVTQSSDDNVMKILERASAERALSSKEASSPSSLVSLDLEVFQFYFGLNINVQAKRLETLPTTITSLSMEINTDLCKVLANFTQLRTLEMTKASPTQSQSALQYHEDLIQSFSYLPASITSLEIPDSICLKSLNILQCAQFGPNGEPPALTRLLTNFSCLYLPIIEHYSTILKTLVCLSILLDSSWKNLFSAKDEPIDTIDTQVFFAEQFLKRIAPMKIVLSMGITGLYSVQRDWTDLEFQHLPNMLKSLTFNPLDSIVSLRFLPPTLTYLDVSTAHGCHLPAGCPRQLPRTLTTLKCGAKLFNSHSYQSMPPSLTDLTIFGAKKFQTASARALPQQLRLFSVEILRFDPHIIPHLPRSITGLEIASASVPAWKKLIEFRDSYPPHLRKLVLPCSGLHYVLCFPPGIIPESKSFEDPILLADALFELQQYSGNTPEELVKMPSLVDSPK